MRLVPCCDDHLAYESADCALRDLLRRLLFVRIKLLRRWAYMKVQMGQARS